jgi:hypothetical protein
MSSADVPVTAPPPAATPPLIRWICTSNPFYIISAGLFLFGLRLSFGTQTRDIDTWALMIGLAAYTLLLAAAALLLVRFARVWNDVRTVLLLVVLMFLATSVTFDELLVLDPARGRGYFLCGLGFAIGLSESVLRGIRLRLSLRFKLPYYLTLALFFLYPLALVPVLREPHREALLWGLWGFAPAAGLVFLTLLPAIRRGRTEVHDNGSPWPWPFYPWSLFAFLAAAVCGRAVLLCWSFHLLPDTDGYLVFGPYFLVPFGFALTVLLLELGIVERSRATEWVALAAPLGLVALTFVGHRPDDIYSEFLTHFYARLGGLPPFVALVAACAFYLCAWVRGVKPAADGLSAALLALACVRPDALTFADLTAPQPGLLLAAVGVQAWVSLWRREWWRRALGAAVALAWAGPVGWRMYLGWREEVRGLDYIVSGVALLPFAVLVSLAKGGALRRWCANPPAATG